MKPNGKCQVERTCVLACIIMEDKMRKWNSFCAWLLLGGSILLMAGGRYVQAKPISEGPGSSDGNNVTKRASLVVHASQKSEYPIPRHITGKFCEHLYFNITNGMDAQILRNPTLCDYPFRTGQTSPDGVAMFHFSREEIAKRIRNGAGRWGWPESEVEALIQSRNEALACWWTKLGAVVCSPDTGPYGGRAQRVDAGRAGQGVAQWTWLPLHRVREYEFEILMRSPDVDTVAVAFFEPGGKEICVKRTVSGISRHWQKFEGTLRIPESLPADKAYKFVLMADRAGQFVVDRILLRPADHINGADPDVIRFLRESKLSILRWPGGNFVSSYHWRDGVGPVEQRPTLPNYAWGEQENNCFGTDEFIAFCRAVGCEPMICANAGSGTPEEAAQWIEYCNGSAKTPMGALRAANGHPEPYGVEYWEVGNELWGRWQYRWTTAEGYVDRYREFSEAMLKIDPTIRLYACGAPVMWGKKWNDTLIRGTGDILVRTTDHPLVGGRVAADADPLDVYRDFMAVPGVLERKWGQLRDDMVGAGIKQPSLAVTELQMFARLGEPSKADAQRLINHANLVSPNTHAEALYDVLVYHAAIRLAPFVEMVTHSATVNHGGGLRKSRERVFANPCHYAQAVFADFAGAVPVAVEINSPKEKAPLVLPDLRNVTKDCSYKVIDSVAALDRKGDLLISVVHRGASQPVQLSITFEGFKPEPRAQVRTLVADVPWAANTLENQEVVKPVVTTVRFKGRGLSLTLRPYSFTCVRISRDL